MAEAGGDASDGLAAVAVLPVAELVRSLAFYERLGFEVLGQWDDYAIVSFGDAEVHLALNPEVDGQPSWSGAYLYVHDVVAVHDTWMAAGARGIKPVGETPYGLLEFATEDLDGNLWRVGSPLPAAPGVDGAVDAEPGPAAGHGASGGRIDPIAAATSTADPALESTTGASDPPRPTAGGTAAGGDLPGGPGTDDTEWLPIVASGLPCAGCGLVAMELHNLALGAQVREEAHDFGELLRAADDDAMRRRPSAGAWSALEHGVHVRDVLHVFADRIVRTLRQDEPDLGWWDHEAAIADGMANESDADAVADDLGRNASLVSEALRLLGRESDWQRRAYRRGVETFTIELLARFTLHEVVHHRAEAQRALSA